VYTVDFFANKGWFSCDKVIIIIFFSQMQHMNVSTNLLDCWAASSIPSRLILLLYRSFNDSFPLLLKFTVQLLLLITRIQRLEVYCSIQETTADFTSVTTPSLVNSPL